MKHTFKKILSIFLVVFMCLSMFPVGAFAVEEEVINCPLCLNNDNVKATDRVLEESTCTEAAGEWYVCEAIHPATGTTHEFIKPYDGALALHSNPAVYQAVPEKAADCANEGNHAYWYCPECDTYYKDAGMTENNAYDDADATVIPVDTDAHNWGNWATVTEPVCGVSDGEEQRTCSICGKVETNTLTKSEHAWEVKSYDETIGCLTDGEVTLECKNCQETKTELGKGWNHELVKTDAKAATCTEDGNVAYYTCRQCGKYFLDDMTETTADSVVIKAAHDTTAIPAKAATCTEDGNVAYWVCAGDCASIYLDADCTKPVQNMELEVVRPAVGHDMTHVEEVAATCEAAGNCEYYACAGCLKNFADEDGKTELQDVALTQLNHVMKELVTAVTADCTTAGTVAYKTCKTCDAKFDAADPDDNLTNKLDSVAQVVKVPSKTGKNELVSSDSEDAAAQVAGIKEQHNWEYKVVKAPTCYLTGTVTWICVDCDAFTNLDDQIRMNTPATNHAAIDLTAEDGYVKAAEPTCIRTGNYAYAQCPDCEVYFLVVEDNGALAIYTTVESDTADYFTRQTVDTAHDMTTAVKTERVEATCGADGNIEYYTCADCGVIFKIENGVNAPISDLADTVISNADHVKETVSAVDPESCMVSGNKSYIACACGKFYETTDTSFQTPKDISSFTVTSDHDYLYHEATYNCRYDGYDAYYSCTYGCGKVFTADTMEETTMDALAVTATGKHDFRVELDPEPCVNKQEHGLAGLEICRVCKLQRKIDQHTYTKQNFETAGTKAPTCTETGLYKLECAICGVFEKDEDGTDKIYESKVVAHTDMGALTHVEAKAETCFENGNIEYWQCLGCGEKFTTANADPETMIGAKHKDGVTTEVVAATHQGVDTYSVPAESCGSTEDVDQFYCSVCENYSMTRDFAEYKDTPYTGAVTHLSALTKIDGSATSCTAPGKKDTYQCPNCKNVYLDAEGKTEATETNVVIAQLSHNGILVQANDATCTAVGNYAYYTACTNGCGKIYKADANGTRLDDTFASLDETLIPKINHVTGDMIPAVESVCAGLGKVTDGNIAYYVCSVCEGRFTTANPAGDTTPLTDAQVKDQTPHVANHAYLDGDIKVASTCTKEGYYAMTCTADGCGDVYFQFTAPLLHKVVYGNVTAVEPTCSEEGKLEFYWCENCKVIYKDSDCTTPYTENGENVTAEGTDELNKWCIVPATGKHINEAGAEISEGCSVDVDRLCVQCEVDFTKEHTMIAAKTEASCKYPESTYEVCQICNWINEETRRVIGEKNGVHPEDAIETRTLEAATCTKEGTNYKFCLLCETEVENSRGSIPVLGHDWTLDAKNSTPVTCVTDGVNAYTCKNGCGETMTEPVTANGVHTWPDEWTDVVGLENDYTTDEAEIMECIYCDYPIYQAHQDVKFIATMDNAVVAGTPLVNTGKVAVTINMNAYEKSANVINLKLAYTEGLIFDRVEFSDSSLALGECRGSGNDGIVTLQVFRMMMPFDGSLTTGEFATVYFDVAADAVGKDVGVEIIKDSIDVLPFEGDALDDDCESPATAKVEMLGDMNGDLEVNAKDAQLVLSVWFNNEYDVHADFDKSGDVSSEDFAALRAFTAGQYSYEELILAEARPEL